MIIIQIYPTITLCFVWEEGHLQSWMYLDASLYALNVGVGMTNERDYKPQHWLHTFLLGHSKYVDHCSKIHHSLYLLLQIRLYQKLVWITLILLLWLLHSRCFREEVNGSFDRVKKEVRELLQRGKLRQLQEQREDRNSHCVS